MLFFIYCICIGVERLLIEKIRVNEKIHFGGLSMTQAEIISVLVLITGIVGCYMVWRKDQTKVAG